MSKKNESAAAMRSGRVTYYTEAAKIRGERRDPVTVMQSLAGEQKFQLGESVNVPTEQRVLFPIEFENVPALPPFCDFEFA